MKNKTNNESILKKQISESNIIDIEAYIFAFCLFLITPVFYIWNSNLPYLLTFVCFFLSVINIENIKRIKFNQLILFIAFFVMYIYIAIKKESGIFGYGALMVICTLPITSQNFLTKVFNKFIIVFSVTLVPSILTFIIVYIFKIGMTSSVINPLNYLKSYNYIQYPFLVQYNDIMSQILPRFCGYYDEPGVIGTISSILLLCTGYNFKKLIYWPIFIAGLLSFSSVFIIVTLVYVFVFLSLKYKIIMVVVLLGIVTVFSENELLNTYVLSRFVYENGKFAGDNRIADQEFDTWFNNFSKTSDYYTGVGLKKAQSLNQGGSSYKDLIVAYGIVPFVFFITSLVVFALSKLRLKKKFFMYLLLLLSVIYQRPSIDSYFYMFLIFTSILYFPKSPIYSKLKASS